MMIKLFAALVIITIIKMGSCELNTTLSGYEVTMKGRNIPVADLIEQGWDQEPTQSPNRFLNRTGLHRIIGGKEVPIEQYAYIVNLWRFGGHRCGGSYIHPDWVLTAVHCVREGDVVTAMQYFKARMGNADMRGDSQFRNLIKMILHEDYETKFYVCDIALLQIDKPFDLGPTVKIGPLQTVPRNYDYVVCTIAGWGYTTPKDFKGERKGAKILQSIDIEITNQEECVKLYCPTKTKKEDRIICAGTPNERDTCSGDSGGPLVCEGKQVGLVSCAKGCWGKEPTMFTRVSSFMGWIRSHIKDFPVEKHTVSQSGNISFKCSVYIIILGEFIFQFILWYY